MVLSIICFTQILICIAIITICVQIKYVRDELLKEVRDVYEMSYSIFNALRYLLELNEKRNEKSKE